jgi:rubrerythrin
MAGLDDAFKVTKNGFFYDCPNCDYTNVVEKKFKRCPACNFDGETTATETPDVGKADKE